MSIAHNPIQPAVRVESYGAYDGQVVKTPEFKALQSVLTGGYGLRPVRLSAIFFRYNIMSSISRLYSFTVF